MVPAMKRLKIWILSFFSLPFYLFGSSITDRLQSADTGAFIVMEQERNLSLLHFHSQYNHTFLFEEITAPSFICDKIPFDWKDWVKKGAPGNTSWKLYSLDTKTGIVTSVYCAKTKRFLSTDSLNAFFAVLCNLPLKEVSYEKRLASSASAKPGQVGDQKPWSPPATFEGASVNDSSFSLSSAVWPKDTTALSGQTLFAYFDESRPSFPFPFWIQMGKSVKIKLKTVDGGFGLISPLKLKPKK